MITGTVTRIYRDKGFGFVKDPRTGTEYFFHRTALQPNGFQTLTEGASVIFERAESPKGPRAEAMRLV